MARVRQLPNKPSALIRVAVDDLTKVERNTKYIVDMGTWHEPRTPEKYDRKQDMYVAQPEKTKCAVCFGGSVIAGSLKVPSNEDACPYNGEDGDFDERFGEGTRAKLLALDSFRTGDVAYGIREFFGQDAELKLPESMNRKVAAYSKRNSAKFKKQMRQLANDLERFGL